MSMFNMVVKPHPLGKYLLACINWAQPHDPEKKYPLLGRLRYVWMDEEYKVIKLLLKDGPTSWSDQQEEITKQINNHESFKDLKVLRRDTVYIEASFYPILQYEGCPLIIEDFLLNINELDAEGIANGFPSITKDPFIIFDEELEALKNGSKEPTNEMNNLMTNLANKINE